MARYTLDIPEMIKSKYSSFVHKAIKNNAKVLHHQYTERNGDIAVKFDPEDHFSWPVPKEWLTEIEEEPVSAEDYAETVHHVLSETHPTKHSDVKFYTKKQLIEAFQAGEQKNELRHREKNQIIEKAKELSVIILNIDPAVYTRGAKIIAKDILEFSKESHNLK